MFKSFVKFLTIVSLFSLSSVNGMEIDPTRSSSESNTITELLGNMSQYEDVFRAHERFDDYIIYKDYLLEELKNINSDSEYLDKVLEDDEKTYKMAEMLEKIEEDMEIYGTRDLAIHFNNNSEMPKEAEILISGKWKQIKDFYEKQKINKAKKPSVVKISGLQNTYNHPKFKASNFR